jgi:hypothetical protein
MRQFDDSRVSPIEIASPRARTAAALEAKLLSRVRRWTAVEMLDPPADNPSVQWRSHQGMIETPTRWHTSSAPAVRRVTLRLADVPASPTPPPAAIDPPMGSRSTPWLSQAGKTSRAPRRHNNPRSDACLHRKLARGRFQNLTRLPGLFGTHFLRVTMQTRRAPVR